MAPNLEKNVDCPCRITFAAEAIMKQCSFQCFRGTKHRGWMVHMKSPLRTTRHKLGRAYFDSVLFAWGMFFNKSLFFFVSFWSKPEGDWLTNFGFGLWNKNRSLKNYQKLISSFVFVRLWQQLPIHLRIPAMPASQPAVSWLWAAKQAIRIFAESPRNDATAEAFVPQGPRVFSSSRPPLFSSFP